MGSLHGCPPPWYSEPPVADDLDDRTLLKKYHKAQEDSEKLSQDEVEMLQRAYRASMRKLKSGHGTFHF